jgi:hypothetical protein
LEESGPGRSWPGLLKDKGIKQMPESIKVGDWVRPARGQPYSFPRGKVLALSLESRVIYVQWYSADPAHPERPVYIWPHFRDEVEWIEEE